jgi:TusA-related sulfurtransferase
MGTEASIMTTTILPEHIDAVVDAMGMASTSSLTAGQVLLVKTTDKNAKRDFQAFCNQTGNPLVAQIDQGDHLLHYLSRRP